MAIFLGAVSLAACGGPRTEERATSIPLEGATAVRIVAEAGGLEVIGQAGATTIEATGTINAPSGDRAAALQFTVTRDGTTILIEARAAGGSESFDARIVLPDTLAIDIEDGSGEITLSGVGPTEIEDSTGGITLRGAAAVTIRDTEGEIDIGQVTGDVLIRDDTSGNMVIREVGGGVSVVRDGAGDMDIIDVRGNVEISSDSTGDILVSDVGGNLTVRSDTNGGIRRENITGEINLPNR